jgi:hypothetical protein
LTRINWSEAPTGEVLHEPAVDHRVYRRRYISKQGIDHLHRNPVPALIRFNDQRCQLGGAIGVATQLSDAHRAAVTFSDNEPLPVQADRIEPSPPHHSADDPLILLACTPDRNLHTAIIYQSPLGGTSALCRCPLARAKFPCCE